jgi:hypothetical protein
MLNKEKNMLMWNAYKSLVVKPEGTRLIRRPRHRWKDNIGMDLKEIRCEDVDLIHVSGEYGPVACSMGI